MHTWHWHTWQELPYLTCSLLEGFAHGFFTQQFAPRVPAELTPILSPAAQTYRVRQVHGSAVLSASEVASSLQSEALEMPDSSSFPPGDGVLTEAAGQAAWVCTADCVPALIVDVSTGQAAAVHAGWRGTASQIVPQAIARLRQQGSQLEHLRVALGPAIAGEVYQVSTAVAAEVGATVISASVGSGSRLTEPRTAKDVDAVIEALWQMAESPLLADSQAGRVRLDVRQVNLLQLMQLGLSREQVAIAPYCTYQTPEHFFSYRRNPQKKVQWSGVVSR